RPPDRRVGGAPARHGHLRASASRRGDRRRRDLLGCGPGRCDGARGLPGVTETVCVVGAGQMGSGIAQVAAVAGYDVTLVDVAPAQLEKARSGIESSLAKLVEKGKVDAGNAEGALGRIAIAGEPGPADIAIEAATEDVDLKLRIFADLDRAAGD